MPDDDLPRDGAGTAAPAGGDRSQPEQAPAFEVSSLFPHTEARRAAQEDLDGRAHDDVGILFADRHPFRPRAAVPRDPVEDLHLTPAAPLVDTAEGHLFDEAELEAHPYTHSFPAPVPARPEPQHAAPGYGISRPQLIAMAVGLVITGVGAGWALATPTPSTPTTVQASPTATVDPDRVAKVDQSIEVLGTAVSAAQNSADSFAAPLEAMAGASDESARLAAEAARQAYVAAIAAVKVPEPAGKSATNTSLDKLERDVAAANTALNAANAGFRSAITMFRQSVPAYAATVVTENADAAEPFRIAVTDAAAAVAASDPFGPAPFAAMDTWRGALAALIADQARAVEEGGSSGSDGSTSGSGGEGAPEPTTAPTQ